MNDEKIDRDRFSMKYISIGMMILLVLIGIAALFIILNGQFGGGGGVAQAAAQATQTALHA